MEDKKSKVVPMNNDVKEPTIDELKAELMRAQQTIATIRMEAQKKIESMNYTNAFQQQQFMMEIVKMKDTFPADMVEKAINAINNFWFEEPEQKEVSNEEQSK